MVRVIYAHLVGQRQDVRERLTDMKFRYDNERDRFTHGYDAGSIIDGTVHLDHETGELVLVDDDGTAFSSQELLRSLLGRRVRMSCVAFDAMEVIEKMIEKAQTDGEN